MLSFPLRKRTTGVALTAFFIGLHSLATVGCAGGVKHPEPGEENNEGYCAKRPDHENNCMACSALPGCGWCDHPQSGKAKCQPGTEHESPRSCAGGWALSSEDCAAPPPPPPPPAAPPPPLSEDETIPSAPDADSGATGANE